MRIQICLPSPPNFYLFTGLQWYSDLELRTLVVTYKIKHLSIYKNYNYINISQTYISQHLIKVEISQNMSKCTAFILQPHLHTLFLLFLWKPFNPLPKPPCPRHNWLRGTQHLSSMVLEINTNHSFSGPICTDGSRETLVGLIQSWTGPHLALDVGMGHKIESFEPSGVNCLV